MTGWQLPWRRVRQLRVAAIAVLLLGLALTAGATLWQSRVNARSAQQRFESIARDVAGRIVTRLQTCEYGLLGARGVVLESGPEAMNRQRFERYASSRDIDREFPGTRGTGVIWRIRPADEPAFVAAVRRDGAPGFSVHAFAPHDGDRYVVTYVEPLGRNLQSLGQDFASEPSRRAAADAATRSGRATLTAPLAVDRPTLTEPAHADHGAAGPPRSFLLLLPFYRPGAPVETVAQREEAALGWTFAPLLIDQVLAELGLQDDRFTLTLRDSAVAAPSFFSTTPAGNAAARGIVQQVPLAIYGRPWSAEFRARPGFLRDLDQTDPRRMAAIGVLLSLMFAALSHAMVQSVRRARLVHDEQARRAAIVDSSSDAIIGESLDGLVTDWNAGAERLFGYRAEDTLGKPLIGLLLPDGREEEDAAIRAVIARGESVAAFDTVRRHRDGTLIDVSVAASPILGFGGRCVGFAKTVREIGAARRAERDIRDLNATLEHRVADRTALLEAAMRENEGLLTTIRTHTIFSETDREGRIVEVNDNFCRISGYSREELVGEDHRIVNSGVQDQAFWLDMWRTVSTGKPWRGEICNRAKDGTLYWVDSMIAPFLGADGRIQKYISVRSDITAAKSAERKLRASQAFLDRVGETAGVGGWQLDLDPVVLIWSNQTYRIHDMEPGAPLDLDNAIAFYPGEAAVAIQQAVDRCIGDGTSFDLELPFVTATGRSRWVRSVGSAEVQGGKTVRLTGAIQDITSRKQAEGLLRQAHDRFAIAADSADIGVWEWDPQAGTLAWDARMYRLYAREPSGTVEPYDLWAENLHPDDREATIEALEAALRGERIYAPEFRIVWPDGEVRHLKASAQIARDAAGKALRVTGVNIDITERKRAELELRATSSLLHTVLESASEVAIIAGDPQLNITVFNRGAERLLGYTASEIVNQATPALIHDPAEVVQQAEALSARLGRTVAPTDVFTDPSTLGRSGEWTYIRKDGSRVRVSLIVTAMHADDGSLLGYLGIAHDVTRQKEYEESLRQAMHKAKHANLAKSQFLANMSHEIRTPMNAVIGLTYLLNQTALDAEQADFLAKIRVASKSLLVVINDVLDLSKIEAGELTLEHAPFALRNVLQELSDMMSVQAESKRIRFTIDAALDLPVALIGDAIRLHQVLTNLVANAIKFTDRGGVALRVERLAAEPESGLVRLRFTVTDSGIGIAPEVQEKLFAPFSQADTSTTRRFGGTGLGLSIVKRVITLMGGDVALSSTPGVGSEFRVEIAFAPCDPTAIPTAHPRDANATGRHLAGVRVLIADDSEINLEVAKRILSLEGAQVALASNGQEAVDLLASQLDSIDVVLMDVQMPVLDGHEATRRIRGELGLTALPVIALTAGALTSEHQKAGAAGMDDFVSKPFDAPSLVRTILRHVQPVVLPAPLLPASLLRAPAPVAEAPATAAEDDWPEIEGIDSDDVRRRLGFDVDLFRSMLQRLLREFADVDDTVDAGDARAREALAARMHKLKGSAGMLGAVPLFRLADHAEAACLVGDARGAKQWCRKIADQITALRNRSEASLTRLDAIHTERLVTAASVPLNLASLGDLVALLNQHSMNALDRFHALAPQLRHELGNSAYLHLRTAIENLQFEEAARMLAGCVS